MFEPLNNKCLFHLVIANKLLLKRIYLSLFQYDRSRKLLEIILHRYTASLIDDGIITIGRIADLLSNACKDISLPVNTKKSKYMEIGLHRGMKTKGHITVRSNSYEKVKTFKYLGSFVDKSKFYLRGNADIP